MTKRAGLSNFAAAKPAAQPAPQELPLEESSAGTKAAKADNRKGMTLRLSPEAWRQLKTVALDEGRTAHDVLIDAVNDYFRKVGKSPLA